MSQKTFFALVIYLICTSLLLTQMHCKPIDNDEEDSSREYNGKLDEKTKNQLRYCDMDLETMELCMRCAKITKSTFVYPTCCANEDGIKDWCHAYIYFGQ